MTEGTLEARIHTELVRLLPKIAEARIEHQKILTLRLGRQVIEIDGEKEEKHIGRLDVLISIDGRPFSILELKKPSIPLTDDDRDQGISYARLLPKMPPLVIITNGADTRFFRTYDKSKWIPNNIDEHELQELFTQAGAVAGAELDDAVKTLLGRSPGIWQEVVRRQTESALADITGDIANLTRPLAQGFSIPRTKTNDLVDALVNGKTFIVLTGPPLSGKTNIAQQVCLAASEKMMIPLYVEGISLDNGVLRHLSSLFCRQLFTGLSPDEVRQWLLHSLRTEGLGRLVIIIDGWPIGSDEQLRADLAELVEFCRSDSLSIILCVDDNTWQMLERVPGRPTKTLFGRKASLFKSESMSDEELASALNLLINQFRIAFFHGVMFNSENHQPRLIRLLAAMVKPEKRKRPAERESAMVLPAVSGLHVLDLAWRMLSGDLETQRDFVDLARAFISERVSRRSDPQWLLFALGRGLISSDTATTFLGSLRLERLKEQGHISMVKDAQGRFFFQARVPELFAAASRICIAEKIKAHLKQSDVEAAYEALIKETEDLPLGDIVGASALVELSIEKIDCLTPLLPRLINDPPSISKIAAGDVASTFFPDVGQINLHFQDAPEEPLIGNTHPWLILSHLAVIPIEDNNRSPRIFREILSTVGDFNHLLRRQESCNVGEMKPFSVHSVPEGGEILCSHQGIVEPITQALVAAFHQMPREIYRLIKFASKKGGIPLISRLITAANESISSTDPEVAKAARRALASLGYTYKKKHESVVSAPHK